MICRFVRVTADLIRGKSAAKTGPGESAIHVIMVYAVYALARITL
jgi:hypothetical protein